MDEIITTMIDKKNRPIDIGGEGENIIAEYHGDEIGRFVFDDNGKRFLAHMHMDDDYQRCGIGVEMIKLAENWYDDFNIVDTLTDDGAAFVNYCKDNNIFKFTHELTHDDRY